MRAGHRHVLPSLFASAILSAASASFAQGSPPSASPPVPADTSQPPPPAPVPVPPAPPAPPPPAPRPPPARRSAPRVDDYGRPILPRVSAAVLEDWAPGKPIPTGYHPVNRVRGGLVTGGALLFGIPFFLTFATALLESVVGQTGWGALLLPGVGPFIAIPAQGGGSGAAAVLVLDGALQSIGVAMFTVGILGQPSLVPDERTPAASALQLRLGPSSKVELLPMLGAGTLGGANGMRAVLSF